MAAFILVATTASARSQNFNIDYGTAATPPTAAYGAASAQTGTWNVPLASTTAPQPLADTTGAATGVTIRMLTSNPVFSFNNPLTSGDDQALMDDALSLGAAGATDTFLVEHLAEGTYSVYTYAWAPDSTTFVTSVNVNGTGAQNVGGAWPPGGHLLGTTYALHEDIAVPANGTITIVTATVTSISSLNGLQLVASPDASQLFASGSASPFNVQAGDPTLLRVFVTPAITPPSTGITVLGNLTPIGGTADQPFFDDGSHGDAVADDNVFSFVAVIPASMAIGDYSVPALAADEQGRTADATIALHVGLTYCAAGATNTSAGNEYVSRVEIAALNNASGADLTGHYEDFTSLTAPGLPIGVGQLCTVTIGNPDANDAVSVFVDWNHDGDFDDAGETHPLTTAIGIEQRQGTVTAPPAALLGSARMRVRMKWPATTAPVPCGNTTYGEVEDYSVNVVVPMECKGDLDGNAVVNGLDGSGFVDCLLNAGGGCAPADMDSNSILDEADINLFVARSLDAAPCS